MGAPKGAPPKSQPAQSAVNVATAAPAKADTSNVPKAPPIHWFFSWIKKEPFGDNVPLVNSTRNALPDVKNDDPDGMGDDSIDLSDISAIGGGGNDGGEDDNPMMETKKELTMAEQLALAATGLKKAPVKGEEGERPIPKSAPKRELTL